jgi:CRISPR-associated exonuclease Cas4
MYDEVYVDFKEIPKEGAEPITYNEELFQHSLSRIRSLHSYCIKEEVPPPEAKQNSDMFWQCNFCPFIVKCNKEMV